MSHSLSKVLLRYGYLNVANKRLIVPQFRERWFPPVPPQQEPSIDYYSDAVASDAVQPLPSRHSTIPSDGRYCVYCGDYYQCRDHIVPVAWESVYRTYRAGETVPSCTECNTYLHDRPYFTLEDRAHYLIDVYIRRQREILRFPFWSEQEIEALGYTLRGQVRKAMYLKDLYRAKLCNLCLSESGMPVEEIHPLQIDRA